MGGPKELLNLYEIPDVPQCTRSGGGSSGCPPFVQCSLLVGALPGLLDGVRLTAMLEKQIVNGFRDYIQRAADVACGKPRMPAPASSQSPV